MQPVDAEAGTTQPQGVVTEPPLEYLPDRLPQGVFLVHRRFTDESGQMGIDRHRRAWTGGDKVGVISQIRKGYDLFIA